MNVKIAHSGLSSIVMATNLKYSEGYEGYVLSENGDRHIDFVLGYGSVILGHTFKDFFSEYIDYSVKGVMLPGYTKYHEELINKLVIHSESELHASFFKTGSESLTAALRLAAHITKRKAFVRCGFLGWHDALLGNSIYWHEQLVSPLRNRERFTAGFRGVSQDEMVFNWSTLKLSDLEEILTLGGDELSCFVFDSYQIQFMDPGVIEEAIAMCKARNLIVIADETKLAGRSSPLGESSARSLDIDLIVAGKALANGFPLSILLGKPEYMQFSKDVRLTGTFSQELSAIYAALATHSNMQKYHGYSELKTITNKVVDVINEEITNANLEGYVSAVEYFEGSMFEIVFHGVLLKDWDTREALCKSLAEHGILVLQGHPSYTCIAHGALDYTDLRRRLKAGLSAWLKDCQQNQKSLN